MKRFVLLLVLVMGAAQALMAQATAALGAYEQGTATIKWVDKKGKPAPVDGVTSWTVSVAGIVTLRPTPPNTICNLNCDVAWASQGQVAVMASADADLGPGVKTITATLLVTTGAAEAVGGEFTVAPPIPDIALTPVSGTIQFVIKSTDDVGVASVQPVIDGAPFGPEITNPPEEVTTTWDTSTVAPGVHVLKGVATDLAGNVGTSTLPVRVVAQ